MILASQLILVTHYSPASTVLWHESSYSSFLYDLGCEMWHAIWGIQNPRKYHDEIPSHYDGGRIGKGRTTWITRTILDRSTLRARACAEPQCTGPHSSPWHIPVRCLDQLNSDETFGFQEEVSHSRRGRQTTRTKCLLGGVSGAQTRLLKGKVTGNRAPCDNPPLRGREYFSFQNAHWSKGAIKIGESTINQRVL